MKPPKPPSETSLTELANDINFTLYPTWASLSFAGWLWVRVARFLDQTDGGGR